MFSDVKDDLEGTRAPCTQKSTLALKAFVSNVRATSATPPATACRAVVSSSPLQRVPVANMKAL
eukprot:34795-Prorocentrum_lima.AAC.1